MISPLRGIRVLDLSWVWAGPSAGRILADLGAEVVKLEAPHRPDSVRALVQSDNISHPDYWDHAGYFIEKNLGKRGMTLDLAAAGGKEVFLKLVAEADILIESFSPRVMAQLGLGFATLVGVQPRLIMVSLSGHGQNGPRRDRTAYGAALEAESGITSTIGYEGGPPVKSGLAYTDPFSGVAAAGAVMQELHRLLSDPRAKGVHVDLSEREVVIPFVSEQLGIWQLDGEMPEAVGNTHPAYAPQGCYRCQGTDRWVAITIRSDEEWTGLCTVIGCSEMAGMSVGDRRANRESIDSVISAFCSERSDAELVELLQRARVPSAAVQDGRDLLSDPQLQAREFFTPITQPLVGTKPFFRFLGTKFEKTQCQPSGPAPRLDEHTEEILAEVGLGEDEIQALRSEGVWGHQLQPGARTNLALPLELLRRIGAVTEVDDQVRRHDEETTRSVRSVDEFIQRALEHFQRRADAKDASFVSGETFRAALERWWIREAKLSVIGPDIFEWTCPGCQSRVSAAGIQLYTLPMFDYALWDFCDSCSSSPD